MEERVQIPRYYRPWPYQQQAWMRRRSGKYSYYFKLWARQLGKDTDDIQYALRSAWDNPGTQSAYIGLDNVWINNNIFKKYIEGRTHWEDYPPEYIEVRDTAKEVFLTNNPEGLAPARIKFIGFLNDQAIIGSSYEKFYVSEASLYPRQGFQYIQPIWDRKTRMGEQLEVSFNGTPRGQKNVLYDLLRTYTGKDDPADFPGEHWMPSTGWCYVDKVTIADALMPDGNGGWKKMYDEEEIDALRLRYLREFGNDNLFRQEHFCDFTTVNAGLVYQGVEALTKEGRYRPLNLDTNKPVYVAFDIASKGKESDYTAAVVFQYIQGRMLVYDIGEWRSVSLVQAIGELAKRDYFHLIRMGILPWDSDRSASSATPLEEARQMFPGINWHDLQKERVDRGIRQVRELLPNMVVNSERCDWLMECFNNYEYRRLDRLDDWSAKPVHNRHSHMMDALRYAAMGINEMQYLQMNSDGSDRQDWSQSYDDMYHEEKPVWDKPYPEHWVKQKRSPGGLYYA